MLKSSTVNGRHGSPKVGVGALIIHNQQLLLAKRKGSHGAGTYGSVGGHLEFGESPAEALKREAKEELGVVLGNLEFIACSNVVMYGQHYLDIGFKAEIISGRPEIQAAEIDKLEHVGWHSLSNLPAPLFAPITVYLEAWQSGQRYYEVSQIT